MEKSSIIKIKGVEKILLDQFVNLGLFNSRAEAVRSAIIKYALDLNLINRRNLWNQLLKTRQRKVNSRQLIKELESLENET